MLGNEELQRLLKNKQKFKIFKLINNIKYFYGAVSEKKRFLS
jgi:hypothetical protein